MLARNFTDNDVSLNHLYEPSISFSYKIRQSEGALACSYVIYSTWLISFELANQHARKVLFTCVVYNNNYNNNNNNKNSNNSNNNSNNKYNNNNDDDDDDNNNQYSNLLALLEKIKTQK